MNESKEENYTVAAVKSDADKYIVGVLDKSIEYYGSHSRRNNVCYNVSRVGIVILSLSLPAVVTYSRLDEANQVAKIAVLVLPIVVAVLAAIDGFFRWGEMWMTRTATQLALQRIKRVFWADWKSVQFESEDVRAKVAYDKYLKLVNQVEDLMVEEEQAFWGRRIHKIK